MTITDGTTTFTYTGGVDTKPELVLERSQSTTSGGNRRAQVSGRRFVDTIKIRIDETDYASLTNLFNQPAANYDYQPDETPGFLTSGDFPMNVSVDIPRIETRAWNGEIFYYVSLKIESVGYV